MILAIVVIQELFHGVSCWNPLDQHKLSYHFRNEIANFKMLICVKQKKVFVLAHIGALTRLGIIGDKEIVHIILF